jgi:hypothetical protein
MHAVSEQWEGGAGIPVMMRQLQGAAALCRVAGGRPGAATLVPTTSSRSTWRGLHPSEAVRRGPPLVSPGLPRARVMPLSHSCRNCFNG